MKTENRKEHVYRPLSEDRDKSPNALYQEFRNGNYKGGRGRSRPVLAQ